MHLIFFPLVIVYRQVFKVCRWQSKWLLLFLLIAEPVYPEILAGQLMEIIENEGDDEGAGTVLLSGIASGISWSNAEAANQFGEQMYCLPDLLSITPSQAVNIFNRHLEMYPNQKEFPAALVMLAALKQVFPCG